MARVDKEAASLTFSARSDPSGLLNVRIHCRGVIWRVSRVEVHQEGSPSLPRGRLALYGLMAPLWLFVCLLGRRDLLGTRRVPAASFAVDKARIPTDRERCERQF